MKHFWILKAWWLCNPTYTSFSLILSRFHLPLCQWLVALFLTQCCQHFYSITASVSVPSMENKDNEQYQYISQAFQNLKKNFKRFRALITRKDFNINGVDKNGRSILLQLYNISKCEKFVQELLQHGANLHLRDNTGSSFLHLAALAKRTNNMKTVQLLIENGADVNAQDNTGLTPLYVACLENNIDMVYLLLYYQADPNIPSDRGLLPVNVVAPVSPAKQKLVEYLCLYSFDEHGTILLPTVAAAMWRDNSPLFSIIVERLPKIKCDRAGIAYFCEFFADVKAKHFKVFVEKFGETLQEVMESVDFLHVVVNNSIEVFNYLLDSPYLSLLVQNSKPYHSIIADYLAKCEDDAEDIHRRIFIMLSKGLHVTLKDLDAVYHLYDACDLYKTMLHLDVVPTSEEDVSSMVRLHYHPWLDVEDCCGNKDLIQVLDYFNSPKVKQTIFEIEGSERVVEMSSVQSLVEVSRNAARKFILKRFNICSCKDFLWVLNGLPIDRLTRSILALERKIY